MLLLQQWLCTGLLAAITTPVATQVVTDFTQETFPGEQPWEGDTAWFAVTEPGTLALSAPSEAKEAYISTPFPFDPAGASEWDLRLALGFPPSGSNRLRIYLAADRPDPAEANEALYLQIGETGTDDTAELYHKQAGQTRRILRGPDGMARHYRDHLRYKVRFEPPGNWSLLIDTTGAGRYFSAAEANYTEVPHGSHFALRCFFTATRADAFFFHYLYAGPPQPDTLPPAVDTLIMPRRDQIQVSFNKPVQKPGGAASEHFTLPGLSATPSSLDYSPHKPDQILLNFDNPLPEREPITLNTHNIEADNGRILRESLDTTMYFAPHFGDIVVSEVMFNPQPAAGLPEHEYIELYNRSDYPVNLGGWRLANDHQSTTIPDVEMQPETYLLLTPNSAVEAYERFGRVIGLSGWPGFKIRADEVVLRDDRDLLVHHLPYEQGLITDPDKTDGGWSLEQIDHAQPCHGMDNLHVSLHPQGGTPGSANTTDTLSRHFPPLFPERLIPLDAHTQRLNFSYTPDSQTAADPARYRLGPAGIQPDSIYFMGADYSVAALYFDNPLSTRQTYVLEIDSILSCDQQMQAIDTPLRTGVPERPERGSILINEVLFNPYPDGSPFVEIVNATQTQIFDARELALANFNTDLGEFSATRAITDERTLLFPGTYHVISRDPSRVAAFYDSPPPGQFFRVSPFIALPNTAGNVYLMHTEADTVDRFHYTEDMHHALLADGAGVSLERIREERPTGDPHNWTSAAATKGYATPGRKNSQHHKRGAIKDHFEVDPPVFSISHPALKDLTRLTYALDAPDYIGTVKLYNLHGQEVKVLANNRILGTEGGFTWSGADEHDRPLPAGTYFFHIQLVHPEGRKEVVRIPVTLTQ